MLESDLQKLSVTGLVTLYELDATSLGAGIFRWHGHVSFEDWQRIIAWAGRADKNIGNMVENIGAEYIDTVTVKRDLIWQGQTYSPVPIQSDGLEMRGDGRASTPELAISNKIGGIDAALSALCLLFGDFVGAKLTVINTRAKYLDAANFVEGNPQAANEYKRQVWYIEQKTSEILADDNNVITFELSNPIDFADAKIPCRQITNYCDWAVTGRYRLSECKYRGTAMFTYDGKPTDNPELDYCGGKLSDCRLRENERRFGGYPSSSMN